MRNSIIVIPALNPPNSLVEYIGSLIDSGFREILIIDDGSSEQDVFDEIKSTYDIEGLHIYSHIKNLGKGRAIKTALNLIHNFDFNNVKRGVITVDSDGQHLVEDVIKIDDEMSRHSDERAIFLGVRDFDDDMVPTKNKYGNKITRKFIRLLYGTRITDTQTGLRGFNRCVWKDLIDLEGERFEYETNMLIYCVNSGIDIREIPICTHYIGEKPESHFNVFTDSFKIYKLILKYFFKYSFGAISSAIIDIGLFKIFTIFLRSIMRGGYAESIDLFFYSGSKVIILATIFSRILSSIYNYTFNRKIVFDSKKSIKRTLSGYYLLCVLNMVLSAVLVSSIYGAIGRGLIGIKISVDLLIFIANFFVQKRIVF